MVRCALAFTLGLLVGFFYPRPALVDSSQKVEVTCPEIPQCLPAPECHPDATFVKALETYQDMLSKSYREIDRNRDQFDTCQGNLISLRRDYDDCRNSR
jgi:hypothetical protein